MHEGRFFLDGRGGNQFRQNVTQDEVFGPFEKDKQLVNFLFVFGSGLNNSCPRIILRIHIYIINALTS